MGFSVLRTVTRGHNSPGLSLPVRKVTVVVDNDVASLSGSLRSNNLLGGHNLSGKWSLVLVHVYWNRTLVIVRLSLKEILCSDLGAESRLCTRCESSSRSKEGGEGLV